MMNDLKQFTSTALGESYFKCTHPSGLDIYVFPKKTSSTFAIFGTKYGSQNNTFLTSDGTSVTVPDGIAHFLEHKLFFNEDGSDSFERFSEYGADANAFTSFDKTAYLFSCTQNLDASLRELISFVTHPYFTEESVKAEIGIISEEIRMYDDNPSDKGFYGMLEGMYHTHSIKRNICGTKKTISQINAQMLYDCYNAFYKPENMVIAVCGNVDTDKIYRIVDASLPDSFRGVSAVKKNENEYEPPHVARSLVEYRMQLSKPMFNIGIKDTDIPVSASERQKKEAIMSILDEMIFSRAGELYNSLFERHLILPSTSYGYTISETFAYNTLSGIADDPEAVLDEIMRYVNRPTSEILKYEDFLRAKKVMYAESVKIFDSSESIASSIFSCACDDAELFALTDAIASVDFDEVKDAFENAFDPSHITLSVIRPLNS